MRFYFFFSFLFISFCCFKGKIKYENLNKLFNLHYSLYMCKNVLQQLWKSSTFACRLLNVYITRHRSHQIVVSLLASSVGPRRITWMRSLNRASFGCLCRKIPFPDSSLAYLYFLTIWIYCKFQIKLSEICVPYSQPHRTKRYLRVMCGQRRPRSDCADAQSDLGHHCPLTESLHTTECMNGKQRTG